MRNGWVGVLAVAVLPAAVSLGAGEYQLTQLPMVPGSTLSDPYGTSSFGTAGMVVVNDTPLPVAWQGGQATLLPILTGYLGTASAINSSGSVVGEMRVASNYNFLPALWVNGQLQILDTAGLSSGAASGINDSGQVVGGISDTNSGEAYAALWQNGQLTKLESNMSAIAINNNGQILLTGEYAGQGGGWIWLNGTMTPVPGINGVSPGVRAMNDNGDVIGGMAISSATTYYSSFISKNGVSSLLPTFADDLADDAFAINDSEQIVGDGFNQSPGTHAIIWENGQVYDLNTLIPANSGWTLDKATAIGNDGTIVGYGTFDGQTSAFELTPTAAPSGSSSVPEPASVATLVLGGVLLLRRRRSV